MENMKRILIITALLVFAGGYLYSQPQRRPVNPNDPVAQLEKFTQFYSYLNRTYVDTVDNRALIEDAIQSVLMELDPHSTYITAEDMVGVRESFDGSFGGIGVEFNVLNDTIIVVNVIAGGPSETVGVLPNDRIVLIDGNNAVGTKQADVPSLLRGPRGSRVEVGIARRGVVGLLDFTIVRGNIPVNTVDAAYKIDAKIGYIKVNRFANNTFREFTEAYQKLGKIDALIVDLQHNGGGLLDQAIDLGNFFLPQGAVIVSTEGMRVPSDVVKATRNGAYAKGKVIILVDETSASGSEIVAGAVQDWDRGLIVGRRTFGKGLVQRQFPFADGSAMRLTIARYHTPTGRAIQRPYEMGQKDLYYEEFASRVGMADTLNGDPSLEYKTLISKRTVYGGGGIYPDVYVPMDTTAYTNYWGALSRRGVIVEFVVDYMDKNRTSLEAKYTDIESFKKNFAVDDAVLGQMSALGVSRGVPPDPAEMEISKSKLQVYIKALIAQKLWGMNEYYYVINDDDEVYRKALEVLSDWSGYGKGITE